MKSVGVVLGSKSDIDVVDDSGMMHILSDVGVGWEMSIISAHRNPYELEQYCRRVLNHDLYIGVAGLAAALPGALAAYTLQRKPVIAVPLDQYGIDSCLRMPPGVPVATTGVGKVGLRNAAILACQILAISDEAIANGLAAVCEQAAKPAEVGFDHSESLKKEWGLL